jgi:mannose-1-phosphate guanylyltransferase
VKALILVGGKATRLLPLTVNTPKSLVPVMNVPILMHLINHLSEHGIKDIVLAQGHLAESIERYFGDGHELGVTIHHSYEEVPLGSAGAAKNAERLLEGTFLVLNSDIFSDMDFTSMLELHRARSAKATIAVTPVNDPTKYGLVEADSSGRVVRFLEKPKLEQVTTNMINAGAWFVEADVLSLVPPETNWSFERNVFPQLLAQGQPVHAYSSGGYWIDMGTHEAYLQMHRDILDGKCSRYRIAPRNGAAIGEESRVHTTSRMSGKVVIAPGCLVGGRACIAGPAVIGPRCVLDDESRIEDSVIWHDVFIGRGTCIISSVIANNCYIGANCVVEGAVVADHVTIDPGMIVAAGSKIEPGTKITGTGL